MKTQEKLKEINEILLNDLKTARLLQLNLVPDILPSEERINFERIFIPSEEVGGDFFYIDKVFNKNNHPFFIALLADVSGHGVSASMFNVLVKDVYNEYKELIIISEKIDLSIFLKLLNKKILNLSIGELKFITIFIALIDLINKKLYFTSAGHPHAYIFNEKDFFKSFGIKNSPPVGIIEDFGYDVSCMEIENNEKIFIFTDGIMEIFEENIENFLKENSALTIKEIREKIEEIIEGKKTEKNLFHYDDITVILIEIKH